jgi:two-component system sensor histidine kinase BaeS
MIASMRLWQRLFLACAGLAVATLAGYAVWQQRSFAQGFGAYLDTIAIERARDVAVRLAGEYERNGGWDRLRRDPGAFGALVFDRRAGEPPRGPPPADRDRDRRDHPGPPPLSLDAGARLGLVDIDGAYVAGSRTTSRALPETPVVVGGSEVGRLRIAVLPAMGDSAESAFATRQLRDAGVAGLVVLAAALALAYALARWLLRPVRALADGTRALASGDYARRLNLAGRDELAALGRDFDHLAATLEAHRDARRRFSADMAHELRTPLTVLRVELDALVDGLRTPTPAALASLQFECERLSNLTDDLYQLSLADAGALEYRYAEVDLAALVADVADHHRGAFAGSGLALTVDAGEEPVVVRADGRRLAQLVDNLLVNARRYTDAPGTVAVSLARAHERAVLRVDDSPPGVDAADLPRLFERLFRVERSRSRAAGGAGLGLAICQAIAQAHGGTILAMPSPLGGLRIEVLLPLATERA